MKNVACIVSVASILAVGPVSAATPTPNASALKVLNQRMRVMLQDVAHQNEQTEVTLQPDSSGLHTIVRVTVHPSTNAQLRADLTKNVNEYISIHQGDCRSTTNANAANGYTLNPIKNGVSQTTLNVPISTLTGHGNVVTTTYGNGAVINCGSL